MRILIVGGGGREHALAHHLSILEGNKIFCAPGNPGTALLGENVDISADDIPKLLDFAVREKIELTVVGPEVPLVDGIVDHFRKDGQLIVGPTAGAARLEGSKSFSKQFMFRYNIPTASFRSFSRSELDQAHEYVDELGSRVVIKASGLAAGKGAVVCESLDSAHATVDSMLAGNAFGSASDVIVVEEFMDGEEASVFALCSGEDYVLLPTAQDHKRIGEGDTGLNTGGMGAYAPAPVVTGEVMERVRERIIEPTLRGMSEEGNPYSGFLYVGLMIDSDSNPRVVEYNCRMGDPETQVVLPLVDSSLTELLKASASGSLGSKTIALSSGSAAVVVLASSGYPEAYKHGYPISGLAEVAGLGNVTAYHAGTKLEKSTVVTAGGRVLGITGTGENLSSALEAAYAGVGLVSFEGMYFRRDIGRRGLTK